jgi:hypothetical protein
MRVERLTVEDNGHVLRYSNGALTTQSTEAATDASRKPPWQIVAAPRLRVAVGQDAQMTIGQPISYLEKRDDGCLELRQEPGQVEGVNLSLKVERAAEKEIRFQPIELKFSRVAGRQPVPDVPLDVGRPIIDSRETSLGCTLDRGNVAVIPLPQNDEDAPILVFLTAEVVAGDDQD